MRTFVVLVGVLSCFVNYSEGQTIKFGSLNMLHDWPMFKRALDRAQIAASEIRREEIDIVGLQEISDTLMNGNTGARLAELLGYSFVWKGLEHHFPYVFIESGIGVVSKYPIISHQVHRYSAQADPMENRSVLRVVIKTPWGNVVFYNTHVSGKTEAVHAEEAMDLARFVMKTKGHGPAVVTGDFNATPDWKGIKFLVNNAHFIDTFATANPGDLGHTCCICIMDGYNNPFDPCPQTNPLTDKIDYVFLVPGQTWTPQIESSKNFATNPVLQPDGVMLRASDHVGVTTVLRYFQSIN